MQYNPSMNQWTPSQTVLSYRNLRLSTAEIYKIQQHWPVAEDGNYYADAVFEGGGIRGLAFLGALRCFDDAGITLRKVAGTSAGAITATLIAAGYAQDDLENIIGNLNFKAAFLCQKKPFIWNGLTPANDLQGFNLVWMFTNLFLTHQKGQYGSKPFKEWLEQHLNKANVSTFASLFPDNPNKQAWYKQRELNVVVSNISEQKMSVLPKDLHDHYQMSQGNFSIAEAVRLSMSIPFFFEPGHLQKSTIVDGGILSNFPLWIFDTQYHIQPRCPTFGFLLQDDKPQPVKGVVSLLTNMLSTMQVARDQYYLENHNQKRVFEIHTRGVSTTAFDLTNAKKDALYYEGYKAAKAFLLQWRWEDYLATRGFPQSQTQSPKGAAL